MGARPLRRAIQRYIEDPLADEVLRHNMAAGSTVQIDRKDGETEKDEPEVRVTITAPKRKKREPVAVGAKSEGSETEPLPDEPEVLPDVPDAPPEDGADAPSKDA